MRKIVLLELLAPMSVTAAVATAALTKLGHFWEAIMLMAAVCLIGIVIERSITVRWIVRALRNRFDAYKPTGSAVGNLSLPLFRPL
ncbi:MAG TPA: hypothetical protein VMH84_08170 [Xanthobacteraceae bacterium]|nr:hypothetical protein [Xanthobacteraceae bacterium]